MGPLAALRPLRRVSQVPEHTTTFHEHDVARGRPLFDPLSATVKRLSSKSSIARRTIRIQRLADLSVFARRMTDVGDESPPQRRVVEASNDPRKDRTARTPRDCRLSIDVQPRRETNATASCSTPCTSPVQVPCKPRRNPVETP